jgi:tRNA-(ms[2]io[6]A)-hydroxylase
MSEQILLKATPEGWVTAACERWQELLVDHLGCEKKAASTAVALIFAYPEDTELTLALSRLAREELRHFEQVQSLMKELAVPIVRTKPGRYAGGLRALSKTSEPERKLVGDPVRLPDHNFGSPGITRHT